MNNFGRGGEGLDKIPLLTHLCGTVQCTVYSIHARVLSDQINLFIKLHSSTVALPTTGLTSGGWGFGGWVRVAGTLLITPVGGGAAAPLLFCNSSCL